MTGVQGTTNAANKPTWFITDAKRLGKAEKTARAVVMTPVFVLGVVGLVLGKKRFSTQFLTLAKQGWLLRAGFNSLMIIPTLALFYNGKAVSRKKLAESGENVAKLTLQALLVVLFVSSITSRKLGKATIPILAACVALRGYVVTSMLTRKVRHDYKSRETLTAALSWGWYAGYVAESSLPILKETVGAGALALGLADHGFGVLHTGFGAASAFAGLLL